MRRQSRSGRHPSSAHLPNNSSVVSLLCKMFRTNEKLTYKKNRKNFEIILDHSNNWIDPVRSLIAAYPLEEWGLVGYRFAESFADILLAIFETAGGAYFSAARTLRSLFESIVQAAYVDSRYPRLPEIINEGILQRISDEQEFDAFVRRTLVEVYSLSGSDLQFLTGFKFAIIDQLDFLNEEERSYFKKIYSELSKIVHPTPRQVRMFIKDAGYGVTFFYDEQFSNKCITLADGVMDAILAILIHSYPRVRKSLRREKYVYKSLVRLPATRRQFSIRAITQNK